ncbi:hypothetical protein PVK06_026328 [Gossypium arboreum]|uniref:Uncharacterized protein n=1 Tax=Gossypium arboreum TaxID=29729 RepID=A0ABR0NXD3_GOSAR|nr:hypothetical protein PVK06_026328 [Gossypium arboreum]
MATIKKAKDINTMRIYEFNGSLQIFMMNLKETKKSNVKVEKNLASQVESLVVIEGETTIEDLQE